MTSSERDARSLRVGSAFLAALSLLLLLVSILQLAQGAFLLGLMWGVTGAGGLVLAWVMKRAAEGRVRRLRVR